MVLFSAVVMDLDGTLLNSRKELTARTLKVLLHLAGQGIKLVIATARPPRAVKELLPASLLRHCAIICYNGALFRLDDGRDRHIGIPVEHNRELLKFAEDDPEIRVSLEILDCWYSCHSIDYVSLGAASGPEYRPFSWLMEQEPTKLLLTGVRNPQAWMERFGHQVHVMVTDQGTLMQVMAKDVSKDAALRELCDLWGMGLEQTIVFGDDYNDLGLFRNCGYPVAMQNAIEELKQLSKEVTVSHDEEGVAVVLERLVCQDRTFSALIKDDGTNSLSRSYR
ncbi:HAD family hydrolase [Paenibacillus puerhi]|uniref:HAD family hydrolase n=1 Tax=Paenibacillus puerhi TaxID=2692622 RepID=UPI00135AE40F|nr:HAD family hydrolase [Paenibacillus puerhi]